MSANYSFTLTLTPDQLANSLQPAFKAKVKSLADEFKNTIGSPVFYWNSTTRRRNGEIVPPGNRNAIDLGGLLQGQQEPVHLDLRTAKIVWTAPYTKIVFDHATTDLVAFTLERLR